jgi:histidine triad (HIT) family protein
LSDWSHAPSGYDCPFCRLVRGVESELNCVDDIVYRDAATSAFIAPKWWAANHGHVLVIPNVHIENIYAIDDASLAAVSSTTRRVAIALKQAYACDGVSTRQHNEPAGNQEVWHLHVHVFPRYFGDRLYQRHEETSWTTQAERAPYAAKLRAALHAQPGSLSDPGSLRRARRASSS